jgi:choice-of-anchor B domain-containing protein
MVDITNPINPQFAGCFSEDGYTHDAQCVVYNGPDSKYQGREICFNYNEDTLTIVDVTVKHQPRMISRYGYTGSHYIHQGWLNNAHTHIVMGDELDEQRDASLDGHTRTMILDVKSLESPKLIGHYDSGERSIGKI